MKKVESLACPICRDRVEPGQEENGTPILFCRRCKRSYSADECKPGKFPITDFIHIKDFERSA